MTAWRSLKFCAMNKPQTSILLTKVVVYLLSLEVSGDLGQLREAVFEDEVTTEAQWLDIVQRCEEHGYHEAVVDLLAAVTVKAALSDAARHTQDLQGRDREQREKMGREGKGGSDGEEEEEDGEEEVADMEDDE